MKQWKSKADWKDPKWVYVNAASTDISQTIARVRREMEMLKSGVDKKVTPINRIAK